MLSRWLKVLLSPFAPDYIQQSLFHRKGRHFDLWKEVYLGFTRVFLILPVDKFCFEIVMVWAFIFIKNKTVQLVSREVT